MKRIGLVVGLQLPDFQAWDPPSWSALAACTTAVVAIVAASIAAAQIRQAIKTRRAQAQPYVAVFMEPTSVSQQFIDLVIRNMGNTVAQRVSVHIEPQPQRSDGQGGIEDVEYPIEIPTLVPGQEWRTLWDVSTTRLGLDVAAAHTATVEFFGPAQKRKKFRYKYDLDWKFYTGRRWVEEYGIHHGAKALREIEKHLKRWREGVGGGLNVYVRDGDAKDRARREQIRQFKDQHAELLAALNGNSSSSNDAEVVEADSGPAEGGEASSPTP
jgi:hypothetical protein